MSIVFCELLLSFIDFVELNIFHLNNRIQINRLLSGFIMLRQWNLKEFQKLMDYIRRGTGSIGRPKLTLEGSTSLTKERNGSRGLNLDAVVDVYIDFMLISC
jgi:hypothetical protein